MPICPKCSQELPQGAKFCFACGHNQSKRVRPQKSKSRGNGQGTVFRLPNGKWQATIIVGYSLDDEGKLRRSTRSRSNFRTKGEAMEFLPQLRSGPKTINKQASFSELYELWLPTHRAGKSTMDCYKSAYKHFAPLHTFPIADIGIDDLQECMDDCPAGKRTRENMKALMGLMYKYAIPRGYIPSNLNYASYLIVGGGAHGSRPAFSAEEVELVRRGLERVPYADYIYCMIYTGYRPNEFLQLDITQYDPEERCLQGGGKTTAGTNRKVTVSPKIQPIIDKLIGQRTEGPIFCGRDGNAITNEYFREKCFYPAMTALGIDPVSELDGSPRKRPDGSPAKLTPYSTRHTFATLMKRVSANDKDKLSLMGHTSEEMLRHYQDVSYDDLRRITDQL